MSINSKFTIKDVLLNQESFVKKNKYSCQFCFEFIYKKSIYQCRSGHYACKECWEKSLENKKECMNCKSEVNSFKDLSRCLIIEQDFGKKQCYCIYSYFDYFIDGANKENENENKNENKILIKDEENGCKEIINIDQIDTHIENCKFKFVKCSHNGCDIVLRLNSLKEHENQCGFKLVKCEYCGCDDTIQMELKEHHDQCPKFPIVCPQSCSITTDRDLIKSHLENDCNNTIIPCKYYEYGCKVEMKRSELQNHLKNVNHQYFMGLLIEKLSSTLSTLSESNKTKDELVKKIDELEKKNDNLSSLVTKMDSTFLKQQDLYPPTFKNKWIISNLSKDVKKYSSQPFDFENQKFRVFFYTLDSIYATIIEIKTDGSLGFNYKYICTLVNNLDKSNSIKFKGPNSICKFFFINEIQDKKNGWLDTNNKITIKIFIKKLNNNIKNLPLESENICIN
ncbi:hypothetical protein ACTFIZ_011952 [Dictyostelium cf. discoideum]